MGIIGPKEMMLQFGQKLLKYFVDPYNLFHDVLYNG